MSDLREHIGSWAIETDEHNNSASLGNLENDKKQHESSKSGSPREPLIRRDLRHKLSSRNDQDDNSDSLRYRRDKDGLSPLRSPINSEPRTSRLNKGRNGSQKDVFSPRRRPLNSDSQPRNNQKNKNGDCEDSDRPKYRRERDDLSPLRSPLTSDQKSANAHSRSDHRRFRDDKSRREGDTGNSSSPVKKNRTSYTSSSPPRSNSSLNMDSDDGIGTPVVSNKLVYQDRNSSNRHRFRRRLDLPAEKDSLNANQPSLNPEIEEDRVRLARREKEISYGKNTDSYKLYIKVVPKEERVGNLKIHPRTPMKMTKCSRRNWDAQIKAWKKHVHEWANTNFPSLEETDVEPAEPACDADAPEKEEMEGVKEGDDNVDDDDLDLNEEEDDSFLEGFELEYALNPEADA